MSRAHGASSELPPGTDAVVARFPARMRSAVRLFHELTGLIAVTTFVVPLAGSEPPFELPPPIHPRCARRLRSVAAAPCREQWSIHLRSSRRSSRAHTHTCPVGLRCCCVPIRFDGHLVGIAKVVVGMKTTEQVFSAAIAVLELILSGLCQDYLVSALSGEVQVLRQCVEQFRQIESPGACVCNASVLPAAAFKPRAAQPLNVALVDKALSHLHQHYQAPDLSLPLVARALGCNPRYLTTRFTLLVGEHMHAYLLKLRVAHACRLLMDTKVPIKETAFASGFRGNAGLARAFRRHVGVTPGDYRRIFAAR